MIETINAASTFVMMLATVVVAIYAVLTVREAKRERRKETIERKLERVYSPLYEILRRAKFEDGNRNKVREYLRAEWVVDTDELKEIRTIVKLFGHYLDPAELGKLSKVLESPRWEPEPRFSNWHGFEEKKMAERFDNIMSRRKDLMSELDSLTRV